MKHLMKQMKHLLKLVIFIVLFVAAFAFAAIFFNCDLEAPFPNFSLEEAAPLDPLKPFDPLDPENNPFFPGLDPAFNYLFILNVPENTAAHHVSNVAIANAGGVVGKCVSYSAIQVSGDKIAVPLAYNNGASFAETGKFYVGFEIIIDAVSYVKFNVEDGYLAEFKGGNGIFNLDFLPEPTPPPGGPDAWGHYLTVLNLPANTEIPNISGVSIENTVKQIGKCKSYSEIIINNNAAFIPLVYSNDSAFTENGIFYITVSIVPDAAGSIVFSKQSGILVNFYDGNGVLDLENLPPPVPPPLVPDVYLTVINLPANTTRRNISAVKVGLAANSVTAVCPSYENISIAGATAFIPLTYSNGGESFSDTGDFFVAIAINKDINNLISVTLKEKIVVHFYEGSGILDLSAIKKNILEPDPSDPDDPLNPNNTGNSDPSDSFDPLDPDENPYFPNLEPEYNYLFILNVPVNTAAHHVSNVAVASAGGVVGKCASYSAIRVSGDNVAIPLAYKTGGSFTETGTYAIGFKIIIDMIIYFNFDVKEGCLVEFKNGNGVFDLNFTPETAPTIPTPDEDPAAWGHYLTILNLPVNTQSNNFSDVYIENTVKQIGKCKSYGEVIVKDNAAFIPLVYSNGSAFTENGVFYVSVRIIPDATSQIVFSKQSGILVHFYDGNGVLDLQNLPAAAPPPAYSGPCLTVLNLPSFTSARNISAVRVGLSASNIVAVCNSFFAIQVNGSTAFIPLSFKDNATVFDSTGSFFVAISVFTDAFNQIAVTLNEKVVVNFLEGNGILDLSTIKKNVAGTDPSDPHDPTNPDYSPLPGDNAEDSNTNSDGSAGMPTFLTVLNLPSNTQASSFSSVQINDSYSAVAKCDSYQNITVTGSTAEIPIVGSNDQSFTSSGFFYVSLVINVDINTIVTIRPNDKRICLFTDGSGTLDLNNLQSEHFDPLDPTATIQSTIVFINLPDDTSPFNISDVFIGNSTTTVAKSVEAENFSVLDNTAFIPVTYVNGATFTESGNFYVSFTVVVDALTTVKRTLNNKCLYYFSNGGTVIDLSNLPVVVEHTLTLINLPLYTIDPNVTEVMVYDMMGNLASVADLENVSVKNGVATIPLVYENDTRIDFFGTGAFYVSFAITVDAVTQIVTTLDDHLLVNFSNGSGIFDITHIPEKPDDPHNLVLYNLPANTISSNITNVKIYNTQGELAVCSDYSAITVKNSQAIIPLVNTADGMPFVMDGFFYLELSVYVDALNRYIITRSNNVLCEFYNGNASFDVKSVTTPGYFSGGLTNESDTKAPILKSGTAFEINGGYVKLYDNVSFPQLDREDAALKIVYLYAYETGQNLEQNYYGVRAQGTYQNIEFMYSTDEPVFNISKNAYYKGSARALFKFLYVRDTSTSADKYLFKTYAKDDFPAFKIVVPSPGGSLLKTYLGENNKAPETLTVQSGIYCFEVVGAGGGGGTGAYGEENHTYYYYYKTSTTTGTSIFDDRGGNGGAGGKVIEVVNFKSAKILEVFTGSGGQGAYRCRNIAPNFGGGGGGGGGGGSYVLTEEYLLCAGGGGGGNGGFYSAAGGAGGAGGSIGPGGGGGGGGRTSNNYYGSRGGDGGGYGAGKGGYNAVQCMAHNLDWLSSGESGTSPAYGIGNAMGYGAKGDTAYLYNPNNLKRSMLYPGKSGDGGNAAYFSNVSQSWKNTNNANGSGATVNTYAYVLITANYTTSPYTYTYEDRWASEGYSGGNGGNNRNTTRGDGSAGGQGSIQSKSEWEYSAAASDGAPGYIKIYKIK
jgi:hypothetical protein